ncbi:MAG: LexA family transcriptional regulator, partial [Cyanobacteriota bacterium ELA615]
MTTSNPTLVTQTYRPVFKTKIALPLFTCPVSAGFPSPAEDYVEGKLDLN